MTRIRFAALLLCAATLAACEKDGVQDLTGAPPVSRVKFFNFGINTPGVNFYGNETKLTAIQSTTGTESVTGVNSGQAAAGGLYVSIDPGQVNFSARIAAATDKDLAIASVPTTVVNGKSYSFYVSGFYDATTKKADAFVVEDALPAQIDFTQSATRFVNASPNASPMVLVVRNTTSGAETVIGAATAYKGATAFVNIPTGLYDLSLRATPTGPALVTRTAVSFGLTRYTVTARGDMTVTSTTAATRPQLDVTTNF